MILSSTKINVLIACEQSGQVRNSFKDSRFNVYSCDILPSETLGNHYQGDIADILHLGWQAIIAFPPCTFLTNAGNSVWSHPGRIIERAKALMLIAQIWESNIPFICIENPKGILSRFIHKPTQIIQPYFFGEPQMKTTCLWLKGFPALLHAPAKTLFYDATHTIKPAPDKIYSSGKRGYFTEVNSKTLTRQRIRSKTFPGIASAMADQWQPFLLNNFPYI